MPAVGESKRCRTTYVSRIQRVRLHWKLNSLCYLQASYIGSLASWRWNWSQVCSMASQCHALWRIPEDSYCVCNIYTTLFVGFARGSLEDRWIGTCSLTVYRLSIVKLAALAHADIRWGGSSTIVDFQNAQSGAVSPPGHGVYMVWSWTKYYRLISIFRKTYG